MFTFKMQDNKWGGLKTHRITTSVSSECGSVIILCCSAQIKYSLVNLNFVSHWSGATRSYWQHSFHSGLDLVRHLVNNRLLGLLKQNPGMKRGCSFQSGLFLLPLRRLFNPTEVGVMVGENPLPQPPVHRLYIWRNISTKTLC